MEEASDNVVRGRGRPPVFTEDEYAKAQALGLFDDVYTRRGWQDVLYRQVALGVVGGAVDEHPELKWLFDPGKVRVGGPGRWWGMRSSILVELGRVWLHHDEELFWTLAFVISRDQPTTKVAIEWIRAVKAGRV